MTNKFVPSGMKRILCFLLLFVFLAGASTDYAFAKKKLPASSGAKKTATTAKKSTSTSIGITTKVSFKPGKKGIVATFSNLALASSVSYSLTYSSRGIQEGAGGSLTDLSGTQTRELLFGTCSAGVCRYHPGVKNAKFTVTTVLKNGKKVSKVFRLKV